MSDEVKYVYFKGHQKKRREFLNFNDALYAAAADEHFGHGVPLLIITKNKVLSGEELGRKLETMRRAQFS